MRKALLAVLFVGCSLAPLPPAGAEPWARFRGPNGTGTSKDTGVPLKWTEQDVLWKAPLPGVGHSSPVVWGDHAFVQSATADGKERLLVCFSAADGKVRWTQSAPGTLASKHQFNSLASS